MIKEQTAWGIAGDPGEATRQIEVTMTDEMRFAPDQLSFKEGETVRLSVTNAGALMHELVIGDEASLRDHAEWMLKFPDMEHDEPYMAHVPPGETIDLVWTFNRAGEFRFACLIPGHYQAGMVGNLSVTRPPSAAAANQAETVTAHAHTH
ncbi:Copper tolerance protein [Thioalkalivibrio nitratireducens DSM 14787]|uniref:Copper tolerance protein n=1 Tax=Thioalkalivibrio nitratireducens (strain DSM 14787 / UNIQEM 213 / ALEN2) TaxID=1255043 RepID=L0DWN5_THIND|nr:Copper tolerance protein [Thioalkalivibrio nitratireducens DSM 14787]